MVQAGGGRFEILALTVLQILLLPGILNAQRKKFTPRSNSKSFQRRKQTLSRNFGLVSFALEIRAEWSEMGCLSTPNLDWTVLQLSTRNAQLDLSSFTIRHSK